MLLLVFQAAPAGAADRAFSARFSANDTGNITIAANTLLTCPAADAACAGAQAGGATNNNQYTMTYVDVDANPTTFDSSTADLSLPAGSTVLFAGLYWGADTSAGAAGGAAAPAAASRGSVLMAPPGAGYATVTASTLDGSTAAPTRYQGFADVTAAVQAGGAGTYTVANVQAGTGQDRYAGWGLVVAYHDPTQPPRNLTVFDGLGTVSGATPTLDIPVSGFVTPSSGPVNTSLGFIAWEGDRGSTGDSAVLNSTTLSDATNPANNFFNSSISAFGSNVTTKNPNYVNQLGYDADIVNANGILGNSASSATIHLTTGGETYLPGVVTFATELFTPRLLPVKSAVDLNGGALEQGDVIQYSLTATNTGQDGAANVVVTDPIPAHTTVVPGSLQVVASPGGIAGGKTDAAGDDQAEVAGSDVVFRVGAGANTANGGLIAPGQSYQVQFQVTIDTPTPDQTLITNTASNSYEAQTNPTFGLSDTSTQTLSTVTAPDLVMTKTDAGGFGVGGSSGFTLSVSNTGNSPTQGLVTVADTVPASLPVTGASGTGWSCGVATQTVTCTRSDALAAGASYPDITVAVNVANSAPSSITNTASVSGGLDGDPSNNDASDTVTVSAAADLGLVKTMSPMQPIAGEPVRFAITTTNQGPSDATNVVVTDPIPAQITGVTATTTQGTCTVTTTITCALGTVPAGGSVTVTVHATVAAGTSGQLLSNTAQVSADQVDPNLSDNLANVTARIEATTIRATKTVAGPTVEAGATVSYRLAITVTGPAAATNVTACDSPPPNTTYVDIDGGALSGGRVCWHFASIAAGDTEVRNVVLRVDRDAPQGPIRNLLIVNAGDAVSVRDAATTDVEGVTPASIPIVTG